MPLSIFVGSMVLCTSLLMSGACIGASAPVQTRDARLSHTTSSIDEWIQLFQPVGKGRFGLENLEIVDNQRGAFSRFIRAHYPAGSSSPRASRAAGVPVGGAQFRGTLPGGPVDRLFLRYFVRFPEDFEFVKGGKLPGLYGGTHVSGGRIPDGTNGFSTRMMWRRDGLGEVYTYLPTSQTWGTSLGRGTIVFDRGRWLCLEQEVVLNTPGQADGGVRVWIDGRRVFEHLGLRFRNVSSLKIEGLFFSTFYGGNDSSWAPRQDNHADFAGIATSPERIGCEDNV